MIKSMTGYGKAEVLLEAGKVTVEIRSLNGKTADISLKTSLLPKDKEIAVRKKIADELQRGNIDPGIAFPVMIGVLAGALTGARLLKRLDVRLLRRVFSFVVLLVAFNMIWQGINGNF